MTVEVLVVGRRLPGCKPRRSREMEAQRAILEYLAARRVFAWRNQAHPVPGRTFTGLAGAPDIIGILPDGRFLGIEVKSETGRLSKFQREFQKRCELAGGVYIVARSVRDVERGLK